MVRSFRQIFVLLLATSFPSAECFLQSCYHDLACASSNSGLCLFPRKLRSDGFSLAKRIVVSTLSSQRESARKQWTLSSTHETVNGVIPGDVNFQGIANKIKERPLLTFSGPDLQKSLAMFESFDDQIMGGISQSTLKPGTLGDAANECAVFSGVVRVEGGGFVGNRMKLLTEPLDLSAYTGLYLKVRGDGKIYKINLRTGFARPDCHWSERRL